MKEEKKHDEMVEKALAMFGRRASDPPVVERPVTPLPPARKPTGMEQLGVRRAPWQIPIREQPTPLVDAILSEISQRRAKGLEWDPLSHSWEKPKDRPRITKPYSPNGPVTAVDMVRHIWRGARVVGPDPTPEDWAAIDADAARWTRGNDGTWRRVVVEDRRRQCKSCAGDHIPAWRRGGKVIDVALPDGTVRSQCSFCGRAAEPNGAR